jgi:uncharacterized protein with FMN-binding domain
MKLFLKIILSILMVFILITAGGIFFLTRGLASGSKLVINDVKLSAVKDGIYNGKYKNGRWTNEVNLTVKDHKITNIDLVKDVLFSKPEVTKELFNNVVKEQNINVDAISGSTITSKAYLKSIENALK